MTDRWVSVDAATYKLPTPVINRLAIDLKEYSVTKFGAVGDGVTDDTAAIQATMDAANGTGAVIFPKGDYLVSARVRLPAGTRVIGYGATIHRSGTIGMLFVNWPASQDIGATPTTTAYNGWGDITIEGLTFDSHGDTNTNNSNTVTFNHARNITVRDCRFLRTVGYHALELTAIDGFLVDNCSFEGFLAKAGLDEKEAIQIDYAASGSVDSGAYDNTMTKNGTIRSCRFKAYGSLPTHHTGVGSHSNAASSFYDNITVRDCKMIGGSRGVNAQAWRNSNIEGVASDTVALQGVRVVGGDRVVVNGCTTNTSATQGVAVTKNGSTASQDCVVSNNVVDGANEGIYVNSDNVVVVGNITRNTVSYGVTLNGANNCFVTGNTIYGAGYTGGALGAVRVTDAAGTTDNNSVNGNKVVKHAAGTEVAAGVSVAAGATNTHVFGNDFLGLAAATSGTVTTTSNRI